MYCNIDNETALNALMNRVMFWTDDDDVITLFEKYYTQCIDENIFSDFDVMRIVDNDYINWFSVMSDNEIKEENAAGDNWITPDRIFAKYNGYNLVYVG